MSAVFPPRSKTTKQSELWFRAQKVMRRKLCALS
jgi:hypothetical protein